MNKVIASLLFLLIVITSCEKKSKLQEEFICETQSLSNTEIINDFKNKFRIEIPKHWKTQLYFDTVQTQIITADTTKNYTNTYTLNFEHNSGDLQINDAFKIKLKEELQQKQLQILKNKVDTFKEKPCIWIVSKGTKNNYDYYLFELFVKSKETSYYKISAEIYGDKNINQRFCESIAVIETLEFLE